MFLNPLMLAGLGGAVLPLVLHLLNRARYRTVDWGAMMFLPGAHGRQQQSNRLKQLLLLILRMALIALLAIALARPVVGSTWAAMGTDPHCCCVILLDNSASMAFDEGGGPRIDAARRAALAVLATLQRGDEVDLLTLADAPDSSDTTPPADLQTAASRIADLRVDDGRADVAAGLTAAARLFQRSNASNRLLVLICDRQASSWNDINPAFASAWRASARQRSTSDTQSPAVDPKLVVITVGDEGSENVAVDRLMPPAGPIVRDVPVPLDVTVHNYGNHAISALPLSLQISGEPDTFQTTLDLAAAASATVTITPRFSTIGPHTLHARIGPDAHVPGNLTFDDELDAIVNVVDPLKVCIITGDPPGDPPGDASDAASLREADALRLALMPYKSAGQKGPDLAAATIVDPGDPWPDDLSAYRVIVLADVPVLTEQQARRIEQFVFGGGGLLVAPGDVVRTQSYDDLLYRDGAGVLPAKLSPCTAPSAPLTVIAADPTSPVFAFLHGAADAAFTATVAKYLPAAGQPAQGHIIASLSDGSPMLIEKVFGRGRALLSTTTLGSDWSTLPRSSLFLPLVQSAVRYLASGREDQQTLPPRQPIEAHFTDAVADRAFISLPDGSWRPIDLVRVGQQQLARFEATNLAGTYQVFVHTAKADQSEMFIVQNTRDESDLTPLTQQRWKDLQAWLNFSRVDPQSADLAAQAANRGGGREMWLALIALVLGITLAETVCSKLLSSEA